MNYLQFKPLCEKDLDLLYQWFQEPRINQMYGRNKSWSLEAITQKYLPRIQGKETVPSYIIYDSNNPIGFIQYYFLTEHFPEGIKGHSHPLFNDYKPNEAVGIDLFIAHANNRGKGLGEQIINCFIENFLTTYRVILVDPNIKNTQAISSYTKAGFRKTTFSEDPKYLIMIKNIASNTGNTNTV
ncbi:TPA: GNAT family N-acetyltransferase [Legionella pneumophila]|nr:GNAT family N-acetyltransferase [Legionella pneumophila]HAU0358584.1 GNAT family N-acetyltransferase [Legionella pneumophila]HAU0567132.1 GNAT family N-acetyltransferase [Legionella pneumophila]